MDAQTLQLLARTKIRLRQEKGFALNTQRFFVEPAYALQILDLAEDCEDIELVSTALELRDRLGLIPERSAHMNALKPAPKVAAKTAERSADSDRYRFGARS